jgi:adenylate cyclase
VLPFQNMSGDAEQEYFADGVVEDIITALSRFKSLFVIARNSSFIYKGKAVDIKQVGRDMGVKYVLEGSVRKAGGRLRITGQLIEAATNVHLWADKFEGPLDDVFELQDRVTSSVVGIVAPKIEQVEVERARQKPTDSLEAYDYYLRGIAGHDRWTREGSEDALRVLSKAIDLDTRFTAAMGRLCSCYTQRGFQRWMIDPKRETETAINFARRAIDIEKEDASVLAWAALTLAMFADEFEAATTILDQALQLNQNMMVVHLLNGAVRSWLGQGDLAVEHYFKALRLSPYDTLGFSTLGGLAAAHFLIGKNDEALVWIEKALANNPRIVSTLRWAAVINAAAGHLEKSITFAKRLLELSPEETIGRAVSHYRTNECKQKLAEALRLAGLPE